MKICKLEGCTNKVKVSRNDFCSKQCYWKTLFGNTINKGIKRTEEYKKKQSEIHKGRKHTEEEIQKQIKAQTGRKTSEETKQKIREAHLGMKATEETRKKQSEARQGKSPWNKGLTKEIDERVKKIGEKTGKKLKGRKNPKHSITMKKIWSENIEYIQKQQKARNLYPNKSNKAAFSQFL